MPNEYSQPDDWKYQSERRGGKDRRKKDHGRYFDDDDGSAVLRRVGQRDRRSGRNLRDLLNDEDE